VLVLVVVLVIEIEIEDEDEDEDEDERSLKNGCYWAIAILSLQPPQLLRGETPRAFCGK